MVKFSKGVSVMKEAFSFIFRFLFMITGLLCMFLLNVSSPKISLFIDDFAVDSQGYIYVGDTDEMIVYSSSGEIVRSIPISTQKCSFTIENDTIIRDIGYEYRVYDLYGDLIDTIARESEEFENLPLHLKYLNPDNEFETVDGTRYVKKSWFGRKIIYRIEKGEYIPVVKMPMQDYCIIVAGTILWLMMVLCATSFAKDLFPERLEELKNDIKNEIKSLYTK